MTAPRRFTNEEMNAQADADQVLLDVALSHGWPSDSVTADAFRRRIAMLRQAAAEGQGWRDIATAPKDGTLVIGAYFCNGVLWRVHEMAWSGLAFYTKTGGSLPQMTHWVPLPTPFTATPTEPTPPPVKEAK